MAHDLNARAFVALSVSITLSIAGKVPAQFVLGTPVRLPYPINTAGEEYSSSIAWDGLELYFISDRGSYGTYVATRPDVDSEFSTPLYVTSAIHPEISHDGLSLYLNYDPGPYGNGDIAFLTRDSADGKFQGPWEYLGPGVNSSQWERWPGLSSDGLELYFTRSPSYEGPNYEIWVAQRASTAEPFGNATKLPDNINVGGTGSSAPEISPDGLVLYFASDRPGGFGAADLWMATRTTTADPWGAPVNLGADVNTTEWEWQPDISGDGRTLYFSRYRTLSDPSDLWQVAVIPEPTSATLLLLGIGSLSLVRSNRARYRQRLR